MKTWFNLCLVTAAAALARLTSNAQPAPFIESQPVGGAVILGGSVTLSADVSGSGLGFQWFKDGVRLAGQTNSSISFSAFQFTNCGSYSLMATNAFGLANSLPALLNVPNAPLKAWGRNNKSQLGNASTANVSSPVSVAGDAVAAAAGNLHSMFLNSDGTLFTMGDNFDGQLGNGGTAVVNWPSSVAFGVAAVAAGSRHSLFVKSDGSLYAMGWNYSGQLGFPSNYFNPNPVPQFLTAGVVAAAAGDQHSLFLKWNGTLWALGYNSSGQFGNGTNEGGAHPVPVVVASNVVTIAAGASHSLFIKSDGTLWGMGENSYGQLGNGTTASTNRPINIASNVVAATGGSIHTLFIKSDGTLWATGYNSSGQLGNGTTANTNVPILVASNVVAVTARFSHSLFAKADGTLWAMGLNNYGQLGNGQTVNTNLPVQVPGLICASLGTGEYANHSLVVGALVPQLSGPTNQHVTLGLLASLSVTVTNGDGPFTYQWQSNGTNIASATNASHAIAAAALSDTGAYTCVVTGMGGASSRSTTLTVGLPPQNFAAQSVSNNWMKLQLLGTANYPYILQSATNLTPPVNWQPVLTNLADTNGNWLFTVTNLTGSQRFYRAAGQ